MDPKYTTVTILKETRKAIKILAIQNDYTMAEMFIELLKAYQEKQSYKTFEDVTAEFFNEKKTATKKGNHK